MNEFDVDAHAAAIDREGFTIIPDFLSPEDLAEVRRVLAFYLGSRTGRNNFDVYRTERVYTLVARYRASSSQHHDTGHERSRARQWAKSCRSSRRPMMQR